METEYLVASAKQFAAGGMSGCFEVCFTYPTEYVKVSLQLDDKVAGQRQFKGAIDVVRQTFNKYGIFGFYRGFSVFFLFSAPKYMCRFGSYEQIKRFFVDENGQLKPSDRIICGLGAGSIEALFVVIPQESVKVKFIHDRLRDKPKYRGLFHGIRDISSEKGIRSLYQGVTPTLIKQASSQAIRFCVFGSLKEWYCEKDHSRNLPTAITPVFGAIAGASSVFANTPLDVVKSRMQGLKADRYSGTLDCVRQIYQREGLLAFYKGLMPRLTKVSLEVALGFTFYTTFIDLFFE